jgi:hypothetical protein
MASATDKLKTGSSVLNDTQARLEETISVGEGVMGELHRNRETMVRVRGNVGVVSGALDEARKLLRGECVLPLPPRCSRRRCRRHETRAQPHCRARPSHRCLLRLSSLLSSLLTRALQG